MRNIETVRSNTLRLARLGLALALWSGPATSVWAIRTDPGRAEREQVDEMVTALEAARSDQMAAALALQEAAKSCLQGQGRGDSCRALGANETRFSVATQTYTATKRRAEALREEIAAKVHAIWFCKEMGCPMQKIYERLDGAIQNPATPEELLRGDRFKSLVERARSTRNVASALADDESKIECTEGDANLLGMGMDCGLGTAPVDPGRITSAPAFVSSDQIEGGEAVGNGALVMRGDTLGEIAQKVRRDIGRTDLPLWGQGGLVDLLAAANGFTDPDRLSPRDGVRIPTKECLIEAAEAGSRQVLSECEALVRVNGVPEDLQGAMRRARERIAERERQLGRSLTAKEREEMLEDITNAAARDTGLSGAGETVPKADFIRFQTERFGEMYRPLIQMVADEAERLGYNDEERFQLLYRRLEEVQNERT